jgi:hypothetical protein
MTEQRRELFKRIMWDYTYTPEQIEVIIQNEGMASEKIMMYRKILMTERWYNIMRILTNTELKEALSDDVLKTIWVQSLRNKYHHAQQILFGTTLSATR